MHKKILILVPHPDDETLSFGGLISRYIRLGHEVHIHVFCVGGPCSNVDEKVRAAELESVASYLGCDLTYDLGFDGRLSEVPNTELTGRIDKMINEYRPDEVYCGAISEHADHQALYNAFLAAARLKSGWMPKLFAVGTYPFSDTLYTNPAGGKIFLPLTEEDFTKKCEAFKLHKSQFKPAPSPLGLDGIITQARYYGMMCGHRYAELFYQLRYIKSLD